PSDPKLVVDQEAKAAASKAATETKSEPVVAELFEEEPAPEVVDVEVITVVEAEPEDEKPEPKIKTAPAPVVADRDDVRPRRSRRPSDEKAPVADTPV